MDIAWDPAKAKANYANHGVRFSEVEPVFYDPWALTIEEHRCIERAAVRDDWQRWPRSCPSVVYTYRGETIRVISARRASPGEVKSYEEGI